MTRVSLVHPIRSGNAHAGVDADVCLGRARTNLSFLALTLILVSDRIGMSIAVLFSHSQHARFRPFSGLLFPMYVDEHLDSIVS